MAKINLYVPDELKVRMDAVDNTNWSDVARPAFYSALAILEHRRNPSMSAAIERLRASKAESLKRDELEGRTHGRAWAEHHADYTDLRRLSELKLETIDHDAFEALVHALDPEGETGLKDLKEHCFGEPDADASDAYIAAFIEGAVEFFKEVADKL